MILGAVQRPSEPAAPEYEVDGKRVQFTADKEIVLRCGKSSNIRTRAGKLLLRGAYGLSRSSGHESNQGGSVQIN